MLALFDVGRPGTTRTELASGSVHRADMTGDLPAPATGPAERPYSQNPPNLVVSAGFAADQAQRQLSSRCNRN
jgi:hypothetical protein